MQSDLPEPFHGASVLWIRTYRSPPMIVRAFLFALLLLAAPLFAEPVSETQVRTWVSQLANDDIAVRDAAQAEMEQLETTWKPALRKYLAEATDPEMRLRLHSILELMSRPQWHTDLPAALAEARRTGKPLLVLATPGAVDGFS